MRIDDRYNELPTLNEMSTLQRILENNGYKIEWRDLERFTRKQYRYALALIYNHKKEELERLLKQKQNEQETL